MANKDILTKNYITGLVSIIIPMYNAESTIAATIQSVLSQTYTNLQVIVIDDCSNDHSCSIVNAIKDNRVTLLSLEKNSGVAISRNVGIENSHGEFLAFLDSDDIWLPTKIAMQINFMLENKVCFCYTGIEKIDENGNRIKIINVPKKCDYKLLQRNTCIATSTVMINQKHFGGIRMPNMRSGQDYATWISLLRIGTVAQGIDIPLVKYMVRSNSLSSNKLKSIKQIWTIQKHQENLSFWRTVLNIHFYVYNAIKKHYG